MIYFKVTKNINIKATDGFLVKYFKPVGEFDLCSKYVYCTSYEDFEATKKTFSGVGSQYKMQIISSKKIKSIASLPQELGIVNGNEHIVRKRKKDNIEFFLNQNFIDINTQIKNIIKDDISLVIIGNLAPSISQQICALTALRILHKTLLQKFKNIKIDLYLNCAQNVFHTRDKDIFKSAPFINNVMPLCITTQQLCKYDFYINMGSVYKTNYFNELNYTDAFLFKFGIDYEKYNNNLKFNEMYIKNYNVNPKLEEQIKEAKLRGKVLLYHPYGTDKTRSIPIEISESILHNICAKLEDYTIVTALDVKKNKDINYINLSLYSKTLNDFTYIISQMDFIITANTSAYHIADAFAIPTVVLFTDSSTSKRINYYKHTKAVEVENTQKNFSNFVFENDLLTLYKFDGWNKIKVKKLLKALDAIGF